MKRYFPFLAWVIFFAANAFGQVTNALPGRSIIKLLPDYVHPRVFALNQANGSVPGTVLTLNPTNGAIINEISVDLNPSDMAVTPAGDGLFVINAGSRTISKIDLNTFSVVSEKAISTPITYSLSNPLYVVAGQSNQLYYTDGAWGPEIYAFDYNAGTATLVLNTGGNQSDGAGGMTLTRSGKTLYTWAQYGWGAGNVNSWVQRYDASNFGTLTALEQSFTSWRRDPLNTPVFLDAAERWVFNKEQMFAATNVSVLLNQFSDNIYGISLDGTIACGPTEVFNTQTAAILTNFSFSTTVQTLSGDQKKLFRYNSANTTVVIYDMASIASVSGTTILPTPADGSVVSPPLTNLTWTVSPVSLAYDVYFGTNQTQVAGATQTSSQYLGRVSTPGQNLLQALSSGATYYWRVDVIGFNSTNTGSVWSFTVSALFINPSQLNLSAIAGFNPASQTLGVTSSLPAKVWSAAVTGSNWVTLNPSSGTTPTNATITFNTSTFAAGTYTNNIEFTSGGIKYELPVRITIYPLNIVKITADRQRPYIYALQAPPLSGQNGLLLFINTTNGNIDKALTIGLNPVDLSINYFEGRLYIASWGETWTYVVDLNAQTLLPSLNLGTDIYKVNAGVAGKIVTEGEDQWIAVNLVNTADGTIAGSFPYPEREGDGECDPSGTFYYHCDNNISDAYLHKFIVTNNTPVEIAGSPQHPYGTRNLVMSADGSRLFWNSYIYDPNLSEFGTLGTEIYSCSTNGSVAFGSGQAFDTTTRQAIYNLPASITVSVVDGKNQRFWYFNSATATLGSVPMSVIESPAISQQPASYTEVAVSNAVYLTVTAMGLSPLSYQWICSATNIVGATNYFLSFNNMQTSQQGNYRVIVSNAYGAVTSTVAQVAVLIPPTITNQPSIISVQAGRNAVLSVSALGTSPMSYQWSFGGNSIASATNSTLTVSNAQSINEGYYQVTLANDVGTATSQPIMLRVLPSKAQIVSAPTSFSVPAGSPAVFTAAVAGSAPLICQWYKNDALLPGAMASQLVISNAQAMDAGTYQLQVSNYLGASVSSGAVLTVLPVKPSFVLQPVSAAAVAGSSIFFQSLAIGSDDALNPIRYAWYFQNHMMTGQAGCNLSLASIAAANQGVYYVVAANAYGVATSMVAQLTVYLPPSFQTGLSNQVVDAGTSVVLHPVVVGTPPLSYSWSYNLWQISNSAASLSLTNIKMSQAGYYSVMVTNLYGSISATGKVSVYLPASQILAWGDDSGGQADVPTNLDDAVAIVGGDYHSVAIRHDGTLTAWGFDDAGQIDVPTNTLRFVSVAAGADHNLAIAEDGSVAAWGRNDAEQTNVPNTVSSAVSVAAGDAHSLALLASGTVVAWGDNTYGQISVPNSLSPGYYTYDWWGDYFWVINPNWIPVQAIAAGRNHNLALLYNGTVVAWGDNSFGQSSTPSNLSNVVAIAAGYLHSAALCSNGTVVVWGDDTYGQTNVPAGLTNVVAIAAGDFDTLALRRNGTVVGWGDNSYGQISVPATVVNAVAVASGNYHGLALIPVTTSLQAQMTTEGLIIHWLGNGVLQWAPSPMGPFTDMQVQGNCITNTVMSSPAKFFRVRY